MHTDIFNERSTVNVLPVLTPKGTTSTITNWWIIIVSVLLRLLPFAFSTPSSLVDLKRVCIILSYTMLLFSLLRNIHIWGARIIAFGTFLNFLAIITNRGFMPVSPDARYLANKVLIEITTNRITLTGSGGVILPINQTRLWFLTDIIPVSSIHTVFSIGDVIISVGILVACISVIRLVRKTIHVHIPEPLISK
jgi:hypothetical protein